MNPVDHLLAPTLDAFAASLARVDDLAAPVAGCPGWDVRALVDHLGGIHQWATAALEDADPDAGAPRRPPEQAPDGGVADLTAWYRRHATALLVALDARPDDAPAWGFGPRPRTAAFWRRRMVHETALHHGDLLGAGTPEAPTPFPGGPEVALDGVDEVVDVFFPRQVRVQRCDPLAEPLTLATDDGSRRWVLAGDGSATAARDAAPRATVSGPPDVLLLALWHRTGADDARLRVEGDAALAAAVLGAPLTP